MVGRTMLAGKINGRGPRSALAAQSGIKVAALHGGACLAQWRNLSIQDYAKRSLSPPVATGGFFSSKSVV
jgi:hypothetical protein